MLKLCYLSPHRGPTEFSVLGPVAYPNKEIATRTMTPRRKWQMRREKRERRRRGSGRGQARCSVGTKIEPKKLAKGKEERERGRENNMGTFRRPSSVGDGTEKKWR